MGLQGPYGSHAWKGIPYARPPLGELRWRAPRPAEPWEGVRAALAFGEACPQIASALGGPGGAGPGEPLGSEDCLTLNVFAPRLAPDRVPAGSDRLPVMVWIHGGGNSIGSADVYEGGRLAAGQDVVVVTVQYRLGPFGWFRHPALHGAEAKAEERSGNYGTLDLIEALRWVRDNVPAFGGDPGNVTLFGESAGGSNVYTLLVSPLARGLFQRAIVQSGGLRSSSVAEAENFADDADPGHAASSSEVVLRLLAAEGAPGRDAARARLGAMSGSELAAWLRARSAPEILAAYESRGGTGMLSMPKVFRDGQVLPAQEFQEALAAGRYNRVPVITGTNRDEAKLFQSFDPEYVRTVFRVPVWVKDPGRYERRAAYQSLMWKASSVDEPAAVMRGVQGPSVFAYRFDWDELPSFLWLDLSRLLGAAHAFEIPFVFGSFDLGWANRFLWSERAAPGRDALSEAMMSYWARFARTGDPGAGRSGDLPRWVAWDPSAPDAPRFLVLDSEEGGGIRMSSEAVSVRGVVARIQGDPAFEDESERCALLAALAERTPGFTRESYARIAACTGLGVAPAAAR